MSRFVLIVVIGLAIAATIIAGISAAVSMHYQG